MPFLIDGYNFLHAYRDSRWGSNAAGRAMICRMLGDWSDATGESVSIVFDGVRPEPAVDKQLSDPRIAVHYSGGDRNADTLIAELVRANSAPRRLAVVSSDNEVQHCARRRDAIALASIEFVARVVRDLQAATHRHTDPAGKSPELDAGARDDWLRQFGYDPSDSPPFEHP